MKNKKHKTKHTPQPIRGGKKHKSRSGTTLVEALIALALFAFFTTGACKLIVTQRMTLDLARDYYTAANIAKNRMELARTFDFDQIQGLNETALSVDKNGFPAVRGAFSRTTTIGTIGTNLYEFAVTVRVRNRKTLEFSGDGQSISTYIAKHL
ncbi:type IV pilus modification PilV family protein [Pontiella sulfatireligans]|uniref:Type II secretion system protein I n=1 Tax=Pontiella sulfatireligans TaxID=2750658 RepID=A0A6C2UIX8_9BACT|nr:hypothetical protein [Pontiella sulfatireligans]VGO19156.1 hypothetical protein SCARR_01213 [Pontiella sulfatireligans]